jgi:dTDP-4-amino-4,6-dideoxy-D-glucose acyltransferase
MKALPVEGHDMRHSQNAEFLSIEELEAKGVTDASTRNLLIHKTCVIVDFGRIRFGRNIRIDPYCIITCAELHLGDHIHIAAGVTFTGRGAIRMDDFSAISNQSLVYSSNDDYSGEYLTNPTVPARYTNVVSQDVTFGRHALLGARCTVLPGAVIEDGVSVGVGSLIKDRLQAWTVYVGVPARPLRERSRKCLELEAQLRAEEANGH